jgi:thiol-disulfide isomerase/thioredoxin
MRVAVSLAACLLFAVFANSQTAPQVGQLAPTISIQRTFQAPPGMPTTLEGLRGRVVVLEFWATWCGPCISAMPHLNELAAKYRDKPVQFLAISNEDAPTVEKFLARGILKTPAAIDTDNRTFTAYGIQSIPRTIIIDREGKVAHITHPAELSEQVLDAVLAGRPVTAGEPAERPAQPTVAELGPPLYQLEIRRVPEQMGGMMMNTVENILQIDGMGPDLLLANVLGVSPRRLVYEGPKPEGYYQVKVHLPGLSRADYTNTLKGAVELALGVEIVQEKRAMPVVVLRAPAGVKGPLEVSSPLAAFKMSSGPGAISVAGVPFGSLIGMLEGGLEQPVVDETGLQGRYTWLLTYTPGDRASLIAALAEAGITAAQETREIDVTVVRPRSR